MNVRFLFPLPIILVCCSVLRASDERSTEFADRCLQRLNDERVISGDAPGWFFPMREIKQLSLGNFWEKSWKEVSRNHSNPIPSMVEFQSLLAEKGVELLVVPIPAKATIYPEKFSSNFQPGEAQGLSPFIQNLRDLGLNVVDLEPLFLAQRKEKDSAKFWCAQDAHFSPMACVEVADLVAEILTNQFGIERHENTSLRRSKEQVISITGDLVAYSKWEKTCPSETLRVQFVDSHNPLKSNIKSPILLLGDSHTLVFSDEHNFHCEGAGLFDHLSAAMGQEIDLEGSASGGLVTSRINLFRKAVSQPGYWDQKKVVVWVFSAREFTQNSYNRGFISIPIDRK